MNITSILITLVGIIIIIALYLMSRITQSKLPKAKETLLPNLKDENGDKFTSVLDDIPARDGITPGTNKTQKENAKESKQTSSATATQVGGKDSPATPNQIILFISSVEGKLLSGNKIKQALIKNGLTLGEMDIYHYLTTDISKRTSSASPNSLFRVANGVEPWTLTDNDLLDEKLAGLSLVMSSSRHLSDKNAVKTLFKIAEKVASDVNGILKNQQQQPLSQEDKELLIPQ